MILRQKIKQISVSSIQKQIKADSDFLSRFLTSREILYCRSKRHFAEPAAARIAVKQACLALFKIPSTQIKNWAHEIEICKQSDGKPFLKLSSKFKLCIKWSRNQKLFLSLAHERDQAIAWIALTDAAPRGSVRKLTPPRGTASGA